MGFDIRVGPKLPLLTRLEDCNYRRPVKGKTSINDEPTEPFLRPESMFVRKLCKHGHLLHPLKPSQLTEGEAFNQEHTRILIADILDDVHEMHASEGGDESGNHVDIFRATFLRELREREGNGNET